MLACCVRPEYLFVLGSPGNFMLVESGIPLTIATRAPSSSGTESGIQYLEYGIVKVESRFQDYGSCISLLRATEEHCSKTIKSDDNLTIEN